ncbi:hypothetical protein LIER_00837 [Lithospermum erythrorhizon]|uniref:Uncharacterized protein n=1 Tax=Lithospermum erythrorhizon TaxID=34254 RepID=A0AAV3NJW7_LITER
MRLCQIVCVACNERFADGFRFIGPFLGACWRLESKDWLKDGEGQGSGLSVAVDESCTGFADANKIVEGKTSGLLEFSPLEAKLRLMQHWTRNEYGHELVKDLDSNDAFVSLFIGTIQCLAYHEKCFEKVLQNKIHARLHF